MSEYVGKNSCSGKKDRIYVSRKGKRKLGYYYALLYMSLRDYIRGYKYDDKRGCKPVPCDEECFKSKVEFVLTLAKWDKAPLWVIKEVEKAVDYVLKHGSLKSEWLKIAKKYIKKRR